MIEETILPDKVTGSKLSTKALQEKMRPYAITAINTAIELLKSTNDNVRLGASKLILAKVLPDLKSSELTTEDGFKFLIQIVQDTKLKDANTNDSTTDTELRQTGTGLQIPDKV